MRLFVFAVGIAIAVIMVVGVAALGADFGTTAPQPQKFVIDIYGGGHGHASYANLAVRPRAPVTITIVNHTAQVHTFTIEELGVNEVVPPSRGKTSTTTVTFTPEHGVLHWRCLPCKGHMRGLILALLELRAGSAV